MMSKFFIEHPVLGNVLAVVLVLIGVICVFRLPVAQYPDVAPTQINIRASYPGALQSRRDLLSDRLQGL